MMTALRRELQEAAADDSTRCVVLRAAGPVFSSGHNLKELTTEQGIEHHVRVFNACNELMEDIFG